MARHVSPTIVMLFLAQIAAAQFAQQGGKLVGTDAVGGAIQAYSVAISADGNTAIIGGPSDSSDGGAAWVFVRNGGVWSQQSGKLVGVGAVGAAYQGFSVAISADGNTALIGAPWDNSLTGAAWVFTRSGGVWSQQGGKLVGTGAVGPAYQGTSVAISGDGNIAFLGGPYDDNIRGAAWLFTRTAGVWAQQGGKLVGTGAIGPAYQGLAVAISGDGKTAIVGGYGDNSFVGAAWIFARSGGVWSQQGSKLVGTGAAGYPLQASAVAISADGNTALVGGWGDSSRVGATWVFTRTGVTWSQQGNKLTGGDVVGAAYQGYSVGISGDGNTAIVGGPRDNFDSGAAWVFTRSGGSWSQQGTKLVGADAVGLAKQGGSVAISADDTSAIIGGPFDDSALGAAWVFTSSATQLAFKQQPTPTIAQQPITPPVTVQLQDSDGTPVAEAGVTITLMLSSGTGTLAGTCSQVTDTLGLASFNDLSIDLVGSKTLTATNPGRASAISSAFTISGPAASIVATGGT
ncbi:MAG: hypothetical protein ACM3JP_03080, partial [Betaproteobacteria bacterium]